MLLPNLVGCLVRVYITSKTTTDPSACCMRCAGQVTSCFWWAVHAILIEHASSLLLCRIGLFCSALQRAFSAIDDWMPWGFRQFLLGFYPNCLCEMTIWKGVWWLPPVLARATLRKLRKLVRGLDSLGERVEVDVGHTCKGQKTRYPSRFERWGGESTSVGDTGVFHVWCLRGQRLKRELQS